jgi:hypothetical protein
MVYVSTLHGLGQLSRYSDSLEAERSGYRIRRSQWPSGLRGWSTADHLLRLRVRIPPGTWMFRLCVVSKDKKSKCRASNTKTQVRMTDKEYKTIQKKIPVGARFSAPVETGPGTRPASCTVGTLSLSCGSGGRRVALTIPPLNAEVKVIVQLHIYSPSEPSWPVLGRNLPLLYKHAVIAHYI